MKLLILINTLIILLLGTIEIQDRDIAKISAQHIVKVSTRYGSGTAFYVQYKGKILLITNAHVCGTSKRMK